MLWTWPLTLNICKVSVVTLCSVSNAAKSNNTGQSYSDLIMSNLGAIRHPGVDQSIFSQFCGLRGRICTSLSNFHIIWSMHSCVYDCTSFGGKFCIPSSQSWQSDLYHVWGYRSTIGAPSVVLLLYFETRELYSRLGRKYRPNCTFFTLLKIRGGRARVRSFKSKLQCLKGQI